MKKIFQSIGKKTTGKAAAMFLGLVMVVFSITGCGGKNETTGDNGKTKVILNEVAHSIFYAPMYVAIEEGYFAE